MIKTHPLFTTKPEVCLINKLHEEISYYAGIRSSLKVDNNKQYLINHPCDIVLHSQVTTESSMFTKERTSSKYFRYPKRN